MLLEMTNIDRRESWVAKDQNFSNLSKRQALPEVQLRHCCCHHQLAASATHINPRLVSHNRTETRKEFVYCIMEVVGSLSKRWKVVNGVVVAQSERDFTQGPSALPLVPGAPTSAATATTAAAAPKVASGGAGGGAGAGAGAGASAASAAAEVVKQYKKSVLDLETRFQLCRSVGQECEKEAELRALLAAKDHPICYDGFEPSGRMHIAQGIMKAINVHGTN